MERKKKAKIWYGKKWREEKKWIEGEKIRKKKYIIPPKKYIN